MEIGKKPQLQKCRSRSEGCTTPTLEKQTRKKRKLESASAPPKGSNKRRKIALEQKKSKNNLDGLKRKRSQRTRSILVKDIEEFCQGNLESIKYEITGCSMSGTSKKWNQDNLSINEYNCWKHLDFLVSGVYDGHGLIGQNASAYLAKNFPTKLGLLLNSREKLTDKGVLEKLDEAITQVHDELCLMSENEQEMCGLFYSNQNKGLDYGTTLSTCVVLPNGRVVLTTVGDSKIMLFEKTEKEVKSVWESIDHNINQMKNEHSRLLQAGGKVICRSKFEYRLTPVDPKYRNLGINMSRAIGHHLLSKCGLICKGVNHEFDLDAGKEYIVLLATDGLWDVVKNKVVKEIVRSKHNDLPSCVDALLQKSVLGWKEADQNSDDTTVVMCHLKLDSKSDSLEF